MFIECYFQTAHIFFECTSKKKKNIFYCLFCIYLMLTLKGALAG